MIGEKKMASLSQLFPNQQQNHGNQIQLLRKLQGPVPLPILQMKAQKS